MATFNSTSFIVDDADPKITYSPGWALDTSSATPRFNRTLHIANVTGQWASLNFTGVSVAVYGDYGVDAFQFALSSYAIDGTQVGTYKPPFTFSTSKSTLANNVLFFQSPPLTQGTHVLSITVDLAAPPGLFYLDYIVYTPGSHTSSQLQSTSSSPASTAVSSVAASSSIASIAATPSFSSKLPVGAIVGGGIGGMFALVLIAVLGYYCLYRRMMRPNLDSELEIDVEPYIKICHESDEAQQRGSNTRNSNTESTSPQALHSHPLHDTSSDSLGKPSIPNILSRSLQSVTSETATSSATTAMTAAHRSETTLHSFVTLQHNDSGIRLQLVPGQTIPEMLIHELPPAYTRATDGYQGGVFLC